jgi:hypothetical protein
MIRRLIALFLRPTPPEIARIEARRAAIADRRKRHAPTRDLIEAKVTCANIEHNRTVLGEHVGDQIMVLMVDSTIFMSERAPVQIDPDQPSMLPDDDQAEAA